VLGTSSKLADNAFGGVIATGAGTKQRESFDRSNAFVLDHQVHGSPFAGGLLVNLLKSTM
jgi:hypothetical protein